MRWIGAALAVSVAIVTTAAVAMSLDALHVFFVALLDVALLYLRICGGLFVLVVLAAGVYMFARQHHEHNRMRDGAFPLREYWLEPWPVRILNTLRGRVSTRVLLNTTNMMSHVAAIGAFGVRQFEPEQGWEAQLAYARDVEKTNRVRAAVVGDAVHALPWANVQRGVGGVANAATGRLLAGAYDRDPKRAVIDQLPAQPEPPQLPAPELAPVDAVAQSRPTELVMGQTAAGELVRWNLLETPHLRYHGLTRGAGKTNAIQAVAVSALRTGAHVTVLDPVQFKDWGDFRGCAELVDTSDPRTLADATSRLLTVYNNRVGLLAREGVRDVSALRRPVQRIVVVMAEAGAQFAVADDAGVLNDVMAPLNQLLRKAGATGVHFVFEDQVIDRWPRGVAGNSWPVIGRCPDYTGQACGYVMRRGEPGTGQFSPFVFWFAGAFFKAPHVQPELHTLLSTVPAPARLVMATRPAAVAPSPPPVTVDVVPRSTVPGVERAGEGGDTPTFSPVLEMERNGGTAERQERAEDDPGRWDDVVAAWFAAHPAALTGPALGVSDLARAMCRDNEAGNDANYEAYKGRAHKLFHEFRAAVRLPGGDRLGTDITTGGA